MNMQKQIDRIVEIIKRDRLGRMVRSKSVFHELSSVAHRRQPELRGLVVKAFWTKAQGWRYHVLWPDETVSCCKEFSLFSAPLL